MKAYHACQVSKGNAVESGTTEQVRQEFARSIVNECINICMKSSYRPDDMGSIIANEIKHHFGIE